MNCKTRRLLLLLTILIPCTAARGDLVTYDLRGSGGSFDFDSNIGTFTDTSGGVANGLEITFQSFIDGVAGDANDNINATSSSLGVNESGSGDDTDELDGDNGLESILISFNSPGSISKIELDSISVNGFSGSDEGEFVIDGNVIAVTNGTNSFTSPFDLRSNSFLVRYTDTDAALGTGFGLQTLTLDITVAAVPEPSSFGIAALCLCAITGRRRRRVANQS